MYCLWILGLFIVSGCASQTKKQNLLGIQKIRIQKLEQQLAKKNEVIAKMKVRKWVSEPPPIPETEALKPLKQKIAKKQWVSALRLSTQLKQSYPQSRTLIKYRVAIFKKMGLKKQAIQEINDFKRELAKKKSKKRQI